MKAWQDKLHLRRLTSTFTILATLSFGIILGSILAHGVHGKEANVDTSDAKPLQIPSPVNLSTTFTQIVKQVGPAVVNINTISIPKATRGGRFPGNPNANPNGPDDGQEPDGQGPDGQGQGQGPDNNFQDFFNHFFGFGGPQGPPGQGESPDAGEREALGSGFIVDSRGYIVTNNHVIDKADKIWVKLSTDPEGDEGHPATLVGTDKDTDIAVLKISVDHPLPTVKFGNSDGTQIGDWVLAIGSPFGLQQTVTAGIISSEHRSINHGSAGEFQHFIQTDAAINPGNSGGPLVSMSGQVIGVNTAIYTQSMGNQGIGFAMPSNTIIHIYNELIGPSHKVVRGSIGITFQPMLSSAVGRVYGFKNGVLISSVTPGFSAAAAGLKPGDIITTIDNRPIKSGDDLIDDIANRKPGSTASIGYVRNGVHKTTTVTISDRTKLDEALNTTGGNGNPNRNGGPDTGQAKLGITVSNVPPEMASKANIHGGVLIRAVKPGSFADNLQTLGPGEVILQINKQPVTDKDQFLNLVSKLKSGDDVVFLVVDPQHPAAGNAYVGGTLP